MNIPFLSLSLLHFVVAINTLEFFDNYEKFLGPNYKAVLKFWFKLDELSEKQWNIVNERDSTFGEENYSEWKKAKDLSSKASEKVVGKDYAYHAGCAALNVTTSFAAYYATCEIIGGVENPVFLKMFDNL